MCAMISAVPRFAGWVNVGSSGSSNKFLFCAVVMVNSKSSLCCLTADSKGLRYRSLYLLMMFKLAGP